LHKQFTVTYPAGELENRVNARLEEMKPRINLKGFRPGKAPVSFLRKQFGKSVMGEVVEAAVNEGSQKAISDNKLKPALQPRIEPVGSVEEVVEGKADLTFKVIVDLMPDFTVTDVSKLTVERLTSDVGDADIGEALDRLAKNARSYATKDGAAEKDDVAVIDYEGSIEGVPFDGGKGEDFSLTLGSGTFIPGFEDGLLGAKAGEARDVTVTFPTEYHAPEMAGKEAVFKVTVKEVKAPEVAYVLEHCGAKLCFTQPALEEIVRAAHPACRVMTALPGGVADGAAFPEPPDEEIAVLLYTSGTTARPRGVAHTHRSMLGSAGLMACLGFGAEQVVLQSTSIMHASGITCAVIPTLILGGTMVLLPMFDAAAALDEIERHRCTMSAMLPAMVQFLVEEQTARPRDVSSLRYSYAGGDTVPVRLQERFQDLFGLPLLEISA
jgi:acyl-CoA synthetase (AMP-forming)/AMP-acid ligase II